MPADHEIVVENLTVQITRGGDAEAGRTMRPVLRFTVGAETWSVSLPVMENVRVKEVIRQIQYAITLEEREAALVVEADLNIPLERQPADPE